MITENSDFALINTAFPMFGGAIKRLWGSKEFVTYMKDLLASVPSGPVGKFPDDVLEALRRLGELHDQEYHHFLPHVDDNADLRSVSEAFPAIGEKLSALWGRKEFGPYMTGLLQNSRGDNRKGFPFEILLSMQALAEQHNKEFAHLFPAVDLWTQLGG
jgi:hypothetical protein